MTRFFYRSMGLVETAVKNVWKIYATSSSNPSTTRRINNETVAWFGFCDIFLCVILFGVWPLWFLLFIQLHTFHSFILVLCNLIAFAMLSKVPCCFHCSFFSNFFHQHLHHDAIQPSPWMSSMHHIVLCIVPFRDFLFLIKWRLVGKW